MPMTAEQLRENLAQAERHIAESKWRIDKQRQLVGGLPLESEVRDEAKQTLVALTESLPILEKHRELIRSWIEEKAKSPYSRRQLLPKAAIGPRASPHSRASGCALHDAERSNIHGLATNTFALKMRPTTTSSASTS